MSNTDHDRHCPQHRLLCTCADCYPPPCVCDLIRALTSGDRDAVRIAAVELSLRGDR